MWFWRAHVRRQVLADRSKGGARTTVASNNGSPRRARISRKLLRREGRSVSAVPVVNARSRNFFCAGAPGACGHPAFPRPSLCPLSCKRVKRCKARTKLRRESVDSCLSARHREERSDEAIQSRVGGSGLLRGACRRAALRADPLARNDAALNSRDNFARLET